MKRLTSQVTILCLSLALHSGVGVAFASAADHSTEEERRPAASPAPIGQVASLGVVKINGQPLTKQSLLWAHDLLEAPPGVSARVILPGVGRLRLDPGARVRVTSADVRPSPASGPGLLAELHGGTVAVRLQPGVGACWIAGASSFLASPGADFRITVRPDGVSADAVTGEVSDLGRWAVAPQSAVLQAAARLQDRQLKPGARRYVIQPFNKDRIPVYEVHARSSRQVQVRVTDEHDRPVPDLPVVFALGGKVGSLKAAGVAGESVTTTTNAQGVATVSFTPSTPAGSAPVTASIPGTGASWTGTVSVLQAGFWTASAALPVLATAGAAAAVTAVTVANKGKGGPKVAGPPVIKP